MQLLIIDSLGVVKIQSDETKTKLVVDVLLVIVKTIILIIMLERNFYFDDNKQTLYVLEYRRNDKSLVSYFIAKDMNTGKVFHIVEAACKSTIVTPEYWWNNAKDLVTIKIKSFDV